MFESEVAIFVIGFKIKRTFSPPLLIIYYLKYKYGLFQCSFEAKLFYQFLSIIYHNDHVTRLSLIICRPIRGRIFDSVFHKKDNTRFV